MNREQQNGKLARAIIGAQIVIAVLVLNALIRGFTLSILWGWFIERLGVTGINVGEAIGFAMVVGFLTQAKPDAEEKPFLERFNENFVFSISSCVFALFFGWIVHLFI